MGDKDQDLGARDVMRRGATESDTQGHGYKWKGATPEQDGTPSHETDTEGQIARFGRAAPDADEPPTEDAEGHAYRVRFAGEGSGEPPEGVADTKGHAVRVKGLESDLFRSGRGGAIEDPPSDDAEGHGSRWHAAPDSDQPPSDDETEGHIRGRS